MHSLNPLSQICNLAQDPAEEDEEDEGVAAEPVMPAHPELAPVRPNGQDRIDAAMAELTVLANRYHRTAAVAQVMIGTALPVLCRVIIEHPELLADARVEMTLNSCLSISLCIALSVLPLLAQTWCIVCVCVHAHCAYAVAIVRN